MEKKNILYVEDDEIEIMKFKMVLSQYDFYENIIVAKNGEEGLTFLNENRHNLPSIIILDINMPYMNGIELLTHIKEDAQLKVIPVIMLTSSNNHKDILESYKNQVAGYFVKPFDPLEYEKIIDVIKNYWTLSKSE